MGRKHPSYLFALGAWRGVARGGAGRGVRGAGLRASRNAAALCVALDEFRRRRDGERGARDRVGGAERDVLLSAGCRVARAMKAGG